MKTEAHFASLTTCASLFLEPVGRASAKLIASGMKSKHPFPIFVSRFIWTFMEYGFPICIKHGQGIRSFQQRIIYTGTFVLFHSPRISISLFFSYFLKHTQIPPFPPPFLLAQMAFSLHSHLHVQHERGIYYPISPDHRALR